MPPAWPDAVSRCRFGDTLHACLPYIAALAWSLAGKEACSSRRFGGSAARHPIDREVITMLDAAAVSYHVILTEQGARSDRTRTKHHGSHPSLFATSSETGSDIAGLRTAIVEAIS